MPTARVKPCSSNHLQSQSNETGCDYVTQFGADQHHEPQTEPMLWERRGSSAHCIWLLPAPLEPLYRPGPVHASPNACAKLLCQLNTMQLADNAKVIDIRQPGADDMTIRQ